MLLRNSIIHLASPIFKKAQGQYKPKGKKYNL